MEETSRQRANLGKKKLYETAVKICEDKISQMEIKANRNPESLEAQDMVREKARINDLTRFEKFKRWAKENITGVSAVAISIAGIITTVVIGMRGAVRKGAQAMGKFGRALANFPKKAGLSQPLS